MDYGVIGIGAIAEAIVTGLTEGVEDALRLLLSPTAGGLNERFWNSLDEDGVYNDVRSGLDRVLAHLNSL